MAAVLVVGWVAAARANETDQFTLPPGKEFVDLGPYFSECHYRVLAAVVRDTNRKIQAALKLGNKFDRREQLAWLHSPAALADTYRGKFLPGFFDMMDFEAPLKSDAARKNFPGKIVLHEPANWIYLYTHIPVDPRKLPLLFPAGTVKCYGVYVGTDKVGHLHDLGHIYFKSYLARRASGQSEKQAIDAMVYEFSRGVVSEQGVIGNWATGVYSNADLAANYIGFLFYRNMTERVKVHDRDLPPLLVRDGEFWKLNDHVGAETDFMQPFFSDHLNEALNPCVYTADVRFGVRLRLQKIAPDVLAFYSDEHGRRRPRAWFDEKVHETWTYYGQDYGHSRKEDNLVTIGNTCFPQGSPEGLAHHAEEPP